MPLQTTVRQERAITIVEFQGSAVGAGSAQFREAIEGQLQAGERKLILDVGGLTDIDSQAVSALIRLQAEAKQSGGEIKLAGAPAALLAGLGEQGAEQSFSLSDNVEAAADSFEGVDSRGIKHFDILEFVKEQAREERREPSTEVH